jgi:hypothetical protein
MMDYKILLVLVGLTGTGKTTTVNALEAQGCHFFLLPNRRELTDRLIISHLQQLDGEPVVPVTDRAERFNYTRRYREMYPGGMAEALDQYLVISEQFPVNSSQGDYTLNTVNWLLVFDGLRGENEVTYAAQNMPNAWFLFLDAPDFVRVQRLLRRNDVFDQVQANGIGGETAVSLEPILTNWLDDQQLAQLKYFIHTGELTIEDVHAKLTIVQKERQNYDPDTTLAALHQYAPDRLIYADTVKYSPEEIAYQVIDALEKVVSP